MTKDGLSVMMWDLLSERTVFKFPEHQIILMNLEAVFKKVLRCTGLLRCCRKSEYLKKRAREHKLFSKAEAKFNKELDVVHLMKVVRLSDGFLKEFLTRP